MMESRRLLIGITGASGSIYAERLIQYAVPHFSRVYVCFTSAGKQVTQFELSHVKSDDQCILGQLLRGHCPEPYRDKVRTLDESDLFAPVASGTSAPTDMVIVPCSMGTLARIAHGMSSNLLERAADVVIKEKKRLVIVPRESPLSTIHLKNMLFLSELGAHIVPPSPGFYNHPKTMDDLLDFVVGKMVDALGMPHDITQKWNHRRI